MSYGRIQKQSVTLKLNNEPFGVQHRPAPRTYRSVVAPDEHETKMLMESITMTRKPCRTNKNKSH